MVRDTSQPSDAEWKILHALWLQSPASARELLERLTAERWAYTTLKTMLTRMADKGLVRERMRAGAAVYEPAIARDQAQRGALRALLERVFQGAAGPLVSHLAEEEQLSEADKREVERRFAALERKRSRRGR